MQKMTLEPGNGEEVEIGVFSQTPSGCDVFVKTLGSGPGRAQRGFPTSEDAKVFVESFQPRNLYVGNIDVEFDRAVYPPLEDEA